MKAIDRQIEGWLDDDYIRVYAVGDRQRIGELYLFETFLPGYSPWASWGFDALCLAPDGKLYLIPWVPLSEDHRIERYRAIGDFLTDLARVYEATPSYEYFGKEVHFTTPIVFGGAPTQEPQMIDQSVHAELCCFWNRTYARITENQGAEQPAARD